VSIHYKKDSNELMVINCEPLVSNEHHYTFTRGGKIVGTIKGTFDFTNLPPKYHELGLQLIIGDTRRVCLALDPVPRKDLPPKKGFDWRRAIGLK
jgi:hypothetical protein